MLNKPKFTTFSINEIKPSGWLKEQLQIQAEGLGGHIDEFWPDIKESGWLGGGREACERLPYFLDGFIPLAFLLEREDLIARAKKYMDIIFSRQQPDGWISPIPSQNINNDCDLWAAFLFLKVLVQWYDATQDERVPDAVRRTLIRIDKKLDESPLAGWALSRWFEGLISIYWLYELTGEQWLLDLATKLRKAGFDWISYFKDWPLKEVKEYTHQSHVVNNAMMLKSPALIWRHTNDPKDIEAIHDIISRLDKYHGSVTGVFTGDEHLAGTSPVRGTELCAVVEYMYSLQHIISVTGDPVFCDRLEKIAYNALPATFSPTMWSHQYDQQVNQMECSRNITVFETNDRDSNIFGLEPNYGCCTANMHQGWPKFVLSACMKSDDGVAVTVWAPVVVNTMINDAHVKIEILTDYPFKNKAKVIVTTEKPVEFNLHLRIPAWAVNVIVAGKNISTPPQAGKFCTLSGPWAGCTVIEIEFTAKPEIIKRPSTLYAVVRGPLVFSLKIGEEWRRVNADVPGRELPHGDFEVYATTPWNYGLCIDPDNPDELMVFEERDIGYVPFTPIDPPVICHVYGRQVKWDKEKGSAAPLPEGTVIGEKEKL
ncbi:MAG TPA: glycoside hydrolase family 127 protein, partial [Clostridia bacterium]|nr:glycoside hydrolase family 127 protein [Clostridia bacterium]